MWQTIDAIPYRGSRIELSAQSRGSATFIHLFLRMQRAAETELVLFGPPPQNYVFVHSGDSWARLGVVAEVPTDADVIGCPLCLAPLVAPIPEPATASR
jgi:hypothetical protein